MSAVHGLLDTARRHHDAGRWPEAEALYRQILAADPGHADALHLLGLLAHHTGRTDVAVTLIRRALERFAGANPAALAEVHNNLGNALFAQGAFEEAHAAFAEAVSLVPDFAFAHSNRANSLVALSRLDEAIAAAERAVALLLTAELHRNLGAILHRAGRLDAAAASFERAIAIDPGFAAAHDGLGYVRHVQGRFGEAVSAYETALTFAPTDADIHNNLGFTRESQGDLAAAAGAYGRALALDPGHAGALNNLGNVHKEQGAFAEALACYDTAIAAHPGDPMAHFNRAELVTFRATDPEIATLEALARAPGAGPYACFALAKAAADTGDTDTAFAQLREGNARQRKAIAYDEPAAMDLFQRVRSIFTAETISRRTGSSAFAPVFIVGMPRSGSTLIDQILASHPGVRSAGETPALDRAAREVLGNDGAFPDYRRIAAADLDQIAAIYTGSMPSGGVVVDKMPGNFLNAGLIRMVFPNARIIHSRRDPLDTCVSCFSKLFREGHGFTYDLAELGRYHRAYAELMAHWRAVLPAGVMLDVDYEDLVADLEGLSRRMLAHCGLPWNAGCLAFHNTKRPVGTASALQVRQPLYKSAVGRAGAYRRFLAPLIAELKAGDPAEVNRHAGV